MTTCPAVAGNMGTFEGPWLRRLGAAALALFAAAAVVGVARSDHSEAPVSPHWPRGPVTLVVTFPPGGGTDTLARRLADALHQKLGQPFVVENRSGASGNIGAQHVARSKADGHTLLVANSSYAINPAVLAELGFDPAHDLTGVINVAYVPSVIVTAIDSPWTDLFSAVEAGRTAQVESAPAYASCGNGTPQHLAAGMLNRATGAQWLHVPYRGCGPALIDVMAGTVGLGVVTASSALPHIQTGSLRALAVTSAERSALLPDIPTIAELGVTGYALNQWHGLLAPVGTPTDVITQIRGTLAALLAEPAMQETLRGMGYDLPQEPPEVFAEIVRADLQRFAEAARTLGLKMN